MAALTPNALHKHGLHVGLVEDVGDTMTGDLILSTSNLILDNTTFLNQNGIIYKGNSPFIHNFEYGYNGTVTPDGNNIFIGEAGNLTTGSTATLSSQSSYLIGIGFEALKLNTTGTQNVAIGAGSMSSNRTGNFNLALGYMSLAAAGYYHYNVALGAYALRNAIAGFNLAIGYYALYASNNVWSDYNVGIGYYALRFTTSGAKNMALGAQAMYYNTTGSYNTAIGMGALMYSTLGGNNIAIGYTAAKYQADGVTALTGADNSVYIGTNVKGLDNNDDNSIVIGYNAVGVGANAAVLGNSNITRTDLKGTVNLNGVFMPVQAPTISAPAWVLGGMYFDTTLNKLRIGGAAGWETVTSV